MRIPTIALLLAAAVVACGAEEPVGADCRVPVLFVHGSGLSAASWDYAVGEFRRAGYPEAALLAVDLVPNDGDNVAAAERQIAAAVEQLIEGTGRADSGCAAKVDIVAHSMGAVSGRWYATRVEPERVRALITIAGSNHGTDALCGLEGRGNRQMCPARSGRGIQLQLNGSGDRPADETPWGVGADGPDRPRVEPDGERRIVYLTVRIDPDEWIVPADSAILDGAGGVDLGDLSGYPVVETSPGNYQYRDPASHDSLPYDPGLVRLLLQMLARSAR